MIRTIQLAALFIALALAGCQDESLPTATRPGGARPAISDGARSGGNTHFFFLPPLVPQPRFTGTLDTSVSPVVEICESTASGCPSVAATFTMQSGPGGEVVRREGGHYQVNWHTDRWQLKRDVHYRIRVKVAGTVIGYADVDVVGGGKELKAVDTREFVPLLNGRTLPIRFRVEQGAVAVISAAAGGTAELADGAVALEFPPGAVEGEIGVTATPLPVGDDGADTGVLPGTRYDFQPSPTEFTEPVTLTLAYPASLPPRIRADRLAVCRMVDGACRPIPGSRVDPVTRTVTAEISSFSQYAITEWPEVLRTTEHMYTGGMHLYTAAGEVLVIPEAAIADYEGFRTRFVSWSPDGSQLVYIAELSTGGGCGERLDKNQREVRVVNADGTGRTTLQGPGCYTDPKWSPAGNKILLHELTWSPTGDGRYSGTGELVVIDTAGAKLASVSGTNVYVSGSSFAWSPDGQQIAFHGSVTGDGSDCICTVNADGSNLRQLVAGVHPYRQVSITWAPDGTQMAFNASDGSWLGLWAVNADGTGLRQLVYGYEVMGPSWSPSGDLILFSKWEYDWPPAESPGVYVVRSDGSGLRALISENYQANPYPAWSPDGTRVAFERDGGHNGIWLINVDGTGLQALTDPNMPGYAPFWRP